MSDSPMATEAADNRAGASAAASSAQPTAVPGRIRERVGVRGLHLGVLYALAVSQPLLNLLGNNADFFTSRQLTSSRVLWFAVVIGLAIPMILIASDVLGGIVARTAGWIVHLELFYALALLLTAQIVRKLAD